MTVEELYVLIEEECKNCENATAILINDEERVELEGYTRALYWVLSVVEEAHSVEEL